jgi:hypothetical protein
MATHQRFRSTRVLDRVAPQVEHVAGRQRSYHRPLWVLAAGIALHTLVHLPGEYATPVGVLVVLILATLLSRGQLISFHTCVPRAG